MVKTTIVETTEKYDDEGKLVERLIREEKTEDGTNYIPSWTSPTQCPWGGGSGGWKPGEPCCFVMNNCGYEKEVGKD